MIILIDALPRRRWLRGWRRRLLIFYCLAVALALPLICLRLYLDHEGVLLTPGPPLGIGGVLADLMNRDHVVVAFLLHRWLLKFYVYYRRLFPFLWCLHFWRWQWHVFHFWL